MAEPDPDEAYQHAALVHLAEQFPGNRDQHMVEGGVGNAHLHGMGVEVGVADLHRDAGGELLLLAEGKGDLLHHAYQQVVDHVDIDGVLVEGALGADAFPLGIGNHRSWVDAVCLFPDHQPVLPQHLLHHFGRDTAQGFDGGNAHGSQQPEGLVADAGNFAYGERRQERYHPVGKNFQLTIGLGLTGSDLAYRFVHRETEGDGKTAFVNDGLPQFMRPFHAAEKAVHAGDIQVVLVDAGLLIYRGMFGDDGSNQVGVFGILLHIPPHDNGIGTEDAGHLHGHGRMYPVMPRFIAATRYHAAVGKASHNHRPADELAVHQSLDCHEKCVEVKMNDGGGRGEHRA